MVQADLAHVDGDERTDRNGVASGQGPQVLHDRPHCGRLIARYPDRAGSEHISIASEQENGDSVRRHGGIMLVPSSLGKRRPETKSGVALVDPARNVFQTQRPSASVVIVSVIAWRQRTIAFFRHQRS